MWYIEEFPGDTWRVPVCYQSATFYFLLVDNVHGNIHHIIHLIIQSSDVNVVATTICFSTERVIRPPIKIAISSDAWSDIDSEKLERPNMNLISKNVDYRTIKNSIDGGIQHADKQQHSKDPFVFKVSCIPVASFGITRARSIKNWIILRNSDTKLRLKPLSFWNCTLKINLICNKDVVDFKEFLKKSVDWKLYNLSHYPVKTTFVAHNIGCVTNPESIKVFENTFKVKFKFHLS